jgi:hypothetical protein
MSNSSNNKSMLFGRIIQFRRDVIMGKKASEEKIEKAIAQSKASLAVEGLVVTREEDELVKLVLRKEISVQEFKRKVLEKIKNE